jgi:hypothetical protein
MACILWFIVCIVTDFIMVLMRCVLFTWNFIFDGDLSLACFPSDSQFSWHHSFGLTSAMESDSEDGLCAQTLVSLKTSVYSLSVFYMTFCYVIS